MKVMCIAEGVKNIPVWPVVGVDYTFVRVVPEENLTIKGTGKTFWVLEEFPECYCFNSALFAPLSDIDETELVNERELVHSCMTGK